MARTGLDWTCELREEIGQAEKVHLVLAGLLLTFCQHVATGTDAAGWENFLVGWRNWLGSFGEGFGVG